jgi:hypothetical protein
VVVLDGTWRQARKLRTRYVPAHVPHVRIDVRTKSLFDPLRTQTQADRCCTLEAAIWLLHELGESEKTTSSLLQSLKVLVDAMLIQHGVPDIHGVFSFEERTQMRLLPLPEDRPRPLHEVTVRKREDRIQKSRDATAAKRQNFGSKEGSSADAERKLEQGDVS